MRGVVPEILNRPWPSTVYVASPWCASNHGSAGSTPVNVRDEPVSHFETHSLPPDTVG